MQINQVRKKAQKANKQFSTLMSRIKTHKQKKKLLNEIKEDDAQQKQFVNNIQINTQQKNNEYNMTKTQKKPDIIKSTITSPTSGTKILKINQNLKQMANIQVEKKFDESILQQISIIKNHLKIIHYTEDVKQNLILIKKQIIRLNNLNQKKETEISGMVLEISKIKDKYDQDLKILNYQINQKAQISRQQKLKHQKNLQKIQELETQLKKKNQNELLMLKDIQLLSAIVQQIKQQNIKLIKKGLDNKLNIQKVEIVTPNNNQIQRLEQLIKSMKLIDLEKDQKIKNIINENQIIKYQLLIQRQRQKSESSNKKKISEQYESIIIEKKNEINNMIGQNSQLKQQIYKKNKDLEDLNNKIMNIQKLLLQKNEEVQSLNQLIRSKVDLIKQLQNRLFQNKNISDQLTKQFQLLKQKNQILNQQITSINIQINKIHNQSTQLKIKNSELSKSNLELNSKIINYEKDLNQINNEKIFLRQNFQKTQQKYESEKQLNIQLKMIIQSKIKEKNQILENNEKMSLFLKKQVYQEVKIIIVKFKDQIHRLYKNEIEKIQNKFKERNIENMIKNMKQLLRILGTQKNLLRFYKQENIKSNIMISQSQLKSIQLKKQIYAKQQNYNELYRKIQENQNKLNTYEEKYQSEKSLNKELKQILDNKMNEFQKLNGQIQKLKKTKTQVSKNQQKVLVILINQFRSNFESNNIMKFKDHVIIIIKKLEAKIIELNQKLNKIRQINKKKNEFLQNQINQERLISKSVLQQNNNLNKENKLLNQKIQQQKKLNDDIKLLLQQKIQQFSIRWNKFNQSYQTLINSNAEQKSSLFIQYKNIVQDNIKIIVNSSKQNFDKISEQLLKKQQKLSNLYKKCNRISKIKQQNAKKIQSKQCLQSKQKQHLITNLQLKRLQLQENLNKITNQNIKLKNNELQLHKKLEMDKIDSIRKQKQKLTYQYESKIIEYKLSIKQLKQQIFAYKNEKNLIQQSNQELIKKVIELQDQLKNLKLKNDQLKKISQNLLKIQEKFNLMKTQNQSLSQNIILLKKINRQHSETKNIQSETKQSAELKQKNQLLEQTITKQKKQIAILEINQKTIKRRLQQKQQIQIKLNKELEKLKFNIQNLKHKESRYDILIEDANKKIRNLEETMQTNSKRYIENIEFLNQEINSLNQKNNRLIQELQNSSFLSR